jgi:hypothetical protein
MVSDLTGEDDAIPNLSNESHEAQQCEWFSSEVIIFRAGEPETNSVPIGGWCRDTTSTEYAAIGLIPEDITLSTSEFERWKLCSASQVRTTVRAKCMHISYVSVKMTNQQME